MRPELRALIAVAGLGLGTTAQATVLYSTFDPLIDEGGGFCTPCRLGILGDGNYRVFAGFLLAEDAIVKTVTVQLATDGGAPFDPVSLSFWDSSRTTEVSSETQTNAQYTSQPVEGSLWSSSVITFDIADVALTQGMYYLSVYGEFYSSPLGWSYINAEPALPIFQTLLTVGGEFSERVVDSQTVLFALDGCYRSDTACLAADTSVPEPGTLALFGLGLAGLGFTRRRAH